MMNDQIILKTLRIQKLILVFKHYLVLVHGKNAKFLKIFSEDTPRNNS
jgi:hypothetical protein